jgi:hypothetical protein
MAAAARTLALCRGFKVTLARCGESLGEIGDRQEFGPVLRFAGPISLSEQHGIHQKLPTSSRSISQSRNPFASPIVPVSISHSSPCE